MKTITVCISEGLGLVKNKNLFLPFGAYCLHQWEKKKEKRKEGRKGGREGGWKEGRKEGRKGGRKEGRKEMRKKEISSLI